MERRLPDRSLLGIDVVADLSAVNTKYAYLGIPYGPPYDPQDLSVAAGAADAVRNVTHRMEYLTWFHYDFDLGDEMFTDNTPNIVDVGDLVGDLRYPDAISSACIETLGALVSQGTIPITVGALDAVSPMMAAAYAGHEELNVLHIDAHLDFREEVNGVRHGYSSHIRRVREHEHIDRIVQVGLRSMGSARPSDVLEAVETGNLLVTAWELHEHGLAKLLSLLDDSRRWIVTIDLDGLDPTIAPGVGWPEPGGLTYPQVGGIIRYLAKKHLIAGLVFTEFQPGRDRDEITARTISRLIVNTIGLQR